MMIDLSSILHLLLLTLVIGGSFAQHQIYTFEITDAAFRIRYGSAPCACTSDAMESGVARRSSGGTKHYRNDTHTFQGFESPNDFFFSAPGPSLLICDQECECEYAVYNSTQSAVSGNLFVPNGTVCTITSSDDGNIPLSPFDGIYDVLYDVSGAESVTYACPVRVRGDKGNPHAVERGYFKSHSFYQPFNVTTTENMNSKPFGAIEYSDPQDDIIYIKTDSTCTCIGEESCKVIETTAPSVSPSPSPTTTVPNDTSNAAGGTTATFNGIWKILVTYSGVSLIVMVILLAS